MTCLGFDPVFDERSEILILGSFPSVVSREVGFYYGNKRNRMWSLLSEFFGESVPDSIDGKKDFLLSHRLAMWDIISSCDIVGSLDSDIRNAEVVDLDPIFRSSSIRCAACVGKKAFSLFDKNYSDSGVKAFYLPSTSPANASFNRAEWLAIMAEVVKNARK